MTTERAFVEVPGHFDGDPLVPGAALLAWVQEALPGLVGVRRVRFTAPLRPGEPARLTLTPRGDDVEFVVEGPHGVCAWGVAQVQAGGCGRDPRRGHRPGCGLGLGVEPGGALRAPAQR
ncbi:MAG: hypothetical protein IPN01_09215 [Deltaproteobacteria bacterium]|nr:hypothetical protein [Deltaproteobacteria bacterium]